MQYTLKYRSSRSDVWKWYWKMWTKKLWKLHLVIAIISSFLFSNLNNTYINFISLGSWFLIILPMVVTISSLMPQLMFKSSERILNVNEHGWSTQIGTKSGSRSWAEVSFIEEQNDGVIITGKNNNSLIIPLQAFKNKQHLDQFIADTKNWHNLASADITR